MSDDTGELFLKVAALIGGLFALLLLFPVLWYLSGAALAGAAWILGTFRGYTPSNAEMAATLALLGLKGLGIIIGGVVFQAVISRLRWH